jgi:glycosyltransferase involved in cell wall biosynthesis
MRVLLDTSCVLRGTGGTAVYVRRLVGALREAGVEVVEAADRSRGAPGGGGAASLRNAAHDLRWRASLSAQARTARADVVHHPLPARAWRAPCPQVVTVHDVAFLQAPHLFARGFRTWARLDHRAAARRAAAVVCVSQETRAQVVRRWGMPEARVLVAHHGPGQWAGPPASPPRHYPTHFLYVGDAEPRKNLSLLLEGYRRYRADGDGDGDGADGDGDGDGALDLVLAGSGLESAGARHAGAGVRVESAPDAARLRELHAGAAALVHPALIEGFGLTPLEAMHLGTPVLAVRTPAVEEVCAGAARYLPPAAANADALAADLALLAASPQLRRELSQAGLHRAASFSWAGSARAHIEAYTLALSVSSQTGPRTGT